MEALFCWHPLGCDFANLCVVSHAQHSGRAILISFILVVAISYGFELFSLVTKKGHYDILDAVAGLMGGVIGIGMILFFL